MLGHGILGTFIPGSATTDGMVVLPAVVATAAVGALAPRIDVALVGNEATGDVGLIVANTPGTISVLVSGASATAEVGSIIAGPTVNLTGLAAQAIAGDLAALVPRSVVGVVGTAEAGSIGPDVGPAFTGVSAQASVGSVGVRVLVPLVGAEATAIAGTLIATSPGNLIGVQANANAGTVQVTLDNIPVFELSVSKGYGIDPDPASHLDGTAGVSGTTALQRISGLLPDVTYIVKATVKTALGNTMILWSHIPTQRPT